MPIKQNRFALRFFADFVLTLSGVAGTVFSVVTAFDINSGAAVLIFACVAASLLFTLIFNITKSYLRLCAVLTVAAAIPLTAHLCGGALVVGAKTASSYILLRYSRFIHSIKPFYGQEELSGDANNAETTLFLVFFAIFLTFIIAYLITRSKSVAPAFLVTVPFLALCLFIVNTFPDMVPFATLVTFWVILLLTEFLRKSVNGGAPAVTLILAPAVPALLAAVMLVFPHEGYERSKLISDINDGIIAKLNLSLTVNLYNGSEGTDRQDENSNGGENSPDGTETSHFPNFSGGESEPDETSGDSKELDFNYNKPIDLSDINSIKFNDETILKVYTIYKRNFLLRAYSSGDYAENCWMPTDAAFSDAAAALADKYSEVKRLTSQEFAAEAIKNSKVYYDSFWANVISYDVRNPYIYTPPNFIGSGSFYASDSYCLFTGEAIDTNYGYTIDYLTYNGAYSALTLPDYCAEYEREYRNLVYEYFLNVPETSLECVREKANSLGITASMTFDEKTAIVEHFIENCATYTLHIAPLSEGEDFVTNFLDNTREGFCMHFATAAVLVFRELGMPARYVSGYYVDHKVKTGPKYINITDRQAHAWVEVYCDGVGWVPVNVTPGYATSAVDKGVPDNTEHEVSEPDISGEISSEDTSENSSEESSEILPGKGSTGGINGGWAAACVIIGVIAAAVIRRYSLLSLRQRHFSENSNNKSVLNMWKYLSALTNQSGKPESRIIAIVEKARFSQHVVNESELKEVRSYSASLAKSVYSEKSFFGKFAMKYIHALY